MAKKSSMTTATGKYATKSNPMAKAKKTPLVGGKPMGTPANSDQAKVRKMQKQAFSERDSLRGKSGI